MRTCIYTTEYSTFSVQVCDKLKSFVERTMIFELVSKKLVLPQILYMRIEQRTKLNFLRFYPKPIVRSAIPRFIEYAKKRN